ncbi:hypothetical protein PR003_g31598 [Phytophthora rubi]|uniref:Secreted protein n=1 Tax=Phytophthora rubi TaxID=129364 RepID=A0A6A3IM81_9STRA|nr:hypothetical protein PR001_g33684 [Phytophthora rubi]KAE8980683.1 hypothetical protein PR002_g24048 [Phytophthora rubi]KAE9267981.1 hypothetical protein PR003_g31598 [Phytophthora rubi]
MLCSITQHFIVCLILSKDQVIAGLATTAKRACNTPKARSTSFRTDSWKAANFFCLLSRGVDTVLTKHFHSG